MFGKKEKIKVVETEAAQDNKEFYIILGYGFSNRKYKDVDELKEFIKESKRILFVRKVNDAKMRFPTRQGSTCTDSNYGFDFDWNQSFEHNAITFERVYVPYQNKEELIGSLHNLDDVINYNTAKKIYKDLIEDIKLLDKRPGFNMVNKAIDSQYETIPGEFEPCTWNLSEERLTNKDILAENYVFCTCESTPKDILYYLDDTPCNDIDPIDISILCQGRKFSVDELSILCDFKKTTQEWLLERDNIIKRVKETFGESVCN